MLKKIWAFAITVAIVASCCLIPSSAASLEGSLIANFDFSTGSYEDTLDKGDFADPQESAYGEGTITFVEDETLGKTVAKFENRALQYTLSEQAISDLSGNFTYETYIYFPSRVTRFSLICGTLWYGNEDQKIPNQGAGIVVANFGSQEGNIVGARNTISACAAKEYSTHNIEGDKSVSFGSWVHLVYVHNKDEAKDYFYMNGVDMSNGGSETFTDLTVNADQGFRIGGYNLANNFDIAEMSMAYLKVYAEAATAEDVQTLYSTLGSGSTGTGNNNSGNDSDDDNNTSSGTNPTEVPSSNTDTKDQVSNTKTFDLGIVSLAAVALSSTVVVKKKRK